MEDIKKPVNHGAPWDRLGDKRLLKTVRGCGRTWDPHMLASHFGRTEAAVLKRLRLLSEREWRTTYPDAIPLTWMGGADEVFRHVRKQPSGFTDRAVEALWSDAEYAACAAVYRCGWTAHGGVDPGAIAALDAGLAEAREQATAKSYQNIPRFEAAFIPPPWTQAEKDRVRSLTDLLRDNAAALSCGLDTGALSFHNQEKTKMDLSKKFYIVFTPNFRTMSVFGSAGELSFSQPVSKEDANRIAKERAALDPRNVSYVLESTASMALGKVRTTALKAPPKVKPRKPKTVKISRHDKVVFTD